MSTTSSTQNSLLYLESEYYNKWDDHSQVWRWRCSGCRKLTKEGSFVKTHVEHLGLILCPTCLETKRAMEKGSDTELFGSSSNQPATR